MWPGPRRLFLILTLAAIAACGPTDPSPLPLGRSFELRAGASTTVEGGLTMRFESVASDSRCPIDAICVWEGDATLMMRLSQGRNQPATSELHTQPSGSEIVFSDFRIKLVSVAPYPRSGRQIRSEDYVATVVVSGK